MANAKPQAAAPTKEAAAQTNTAQATTSVASKASTAVEIPDYIKQGTGRGNEGVGTEDITIPRIEIVQALSPCLKPNDAAYIEGAKAGDLFNSITRELYGDHVTVVPVFFKKEYLVWKDRLKGGGFRGAHATLEEAQARILEEPADEQAAFAAQETGSHLVLVVKSDGVIDEAMVSMSRTKLKISRQWNTLIRINGNDRFSRQYMLFTQDDETPKGDFKNFAVSPSGFPTKAIYERAVSLYEGISSGKRKVKTDMSDVGAETTEEEPNY